MNYQTDEIKGHKAVVGHFFEASEIEIGSRWIGSSGNIVTVADLIKYNDWYKVVYTWVENVEELLNEKDLFSFQCRYFLIVE